MTPTTSPSVFAASIIPRFTYIGPPGNAKALISFRLTTLKLYSKLRMAQLGGDGIHEPITQLFHIRGHSIVAQHRHLPLDFRRTPHAPA